MFRRLSEPLPLSAASLLLFRPALNAPVLNVGWLPIGPARAAVVVFAEEYGGIGVALGLRAIEAGQLAVVRNQESIDFDVPIAEALEPLLAEAERMGFLFDEDLLETLPGDRGRSQAMTLWAELMGELDALIPPRLDELAPEEVEDREDDEDASGPLSPSLAVEEAQYPELILDDVAPLELDGFQVATEDESVEGDQRPDRGDDGRVGVDVTETLDPETELELGPQLTAVAEAFPDLEPDFGDDLELEHDFEEALEDALGDPLDDDWAIDDAAFGESDWTEPTAPVAAARRTLEKGRPEASPRPMPKSTPGPGPAKPADVFPARGTSDQAARATAQGREGGVAAPVPGARPAGSGNPPVSVRRAAATTAPRAGASERPETARREVPPRVVLSKFRQVAGSPAGPGTEGRSEVGADRSSELARIPIVRVRRERDPGKRVSVLARLLSSF
ncbi:MAG: hypothetical protein R3F35_17365 [Myxococcota bacterium]